MPSLGPRTLARQAARLNLSSGNAGRASPLVLMTDDERSKDSDRAASTLPPGSIVIVRSREAVRREQLALRMLKIARLRSLIVLIADDPALARRLDADGIHLPEKAASTAFHWRARRPDWYITIAAHSLHALTRSRAYRANAVLLSPVFATVSHPASNPLAPARANMMATHAQIPVYALGGINWRSARRLGSAFAGIAAIDGLSIIRRES